LASGPCPQRHTRRIVSTSSARRSPPHRGGSASSIVATGRLTGQTIGAAFAALCFALAGQDGAVLALAAGAGFAGLGSIMSFLRLTVAPRA
jgi:DHA2 family multidrug resistance protein-like MFS transporter